MRYDRHAAEIRESLPAPGDDPVSRLRHTLAAIGREAFDADWAVRATSGIYGPAVTTGLTYGDLRAILDLLDKREANIK